MTNDLSDDTIRGRSLAEQDWQNQNVVHLVFGDIYTNTPVHDEDGFTLACSFENRAFITAYNQRVRELINSEGLPYWAPGSRMFDKNEIREIVHSSKLLRLEDLDKHDQIKLIRKHLGLWTASFNTSPHSYYESKERKMFLVIGNIGDKVVVDELDFLSNWWIERFELPTGEELDRTTPP
ncbi:MAG: hypothetical protein KDA68_18850 [Planctomycetaceae bacterium]|nr:hypothetical protein [Planctomycetaceae bacterium]